MELPYPQLPEHDSQLIPHNLQCSRDDLGWLALVGLVGDQEATVAQAGTPPGS